jgi:hypothetical protein
MEMVLRVFKSALGCVRVVGAMVRGWDGAMVRWCDGAMVEFDSVVDVSRNRIGDVENEMVRSVSPSFAPDVKKIALLPLALDEIRILQDFSRP